MTSLTQTALAETKESSVVVIAASQTTPILRRLQQEIEALGFAVQVEPHRFAEPPEVVLSSRGAVAAIEVTTTSPGFIALYVLEPKTARIIRQELPIDAPHDPTATELVTTRAVELLRAARLEVSAATSPSAIAPVSPTVAAPIPISKPKAQEAPPKAHAELLLGAGPGLSYVPQWRVGSNFSCNLTYVGAGGFGWVIGLMGTMTPATIAVRNVGSIEAFPTSFRAGAALPSIRGNPIGLRLSGGIEWSQLRFNGQVASPYSSHAVYLSTFAPWIAVGTDIRFSAQFQLVAQLSGSWAMRRTVVRAAGQEQRDWGQPALSGTITLEWRLL